MGKLASQINSEFNGAVAAKKKELDTLLKAAQSNQKLPSQGGASIAFYNEWLVSSAQGRAGTTSAQPNNPPPGSLPPGGGTVFGQPGGGPTAGRGVVFGQPARGPAPAGTLFGQPPPAPVVAFGQLPPPPPPFGQPGAPTGAFGQPAPAQGGRTLFGQPAPAHSFGQQVATPGPPGLFGQPAPTAAPTLFGQPQGGPAQPQQQAGGPTLFGRPQGGPAQPQQQAVGPTLFGRPQGGPAQPQQQAGGPTLFGHPQGGPAQPQQQAGATTLFGQPQGGPAQPQQQSGGPTIFGQPQRGPAPFVQSQGGATLFGQAVQAPLGGNQMQQQGAPKLAWGSGATMSNGVTVGRPANGMAGVQSNGAASSLLSSHSLFGRAPPTQPTPMSQPVARMSPKGASPLAAPTTTPASVDYAAASGGPSASDAESFQAPSFIRGKAGNSSRSNNSGQSRVLIIRIKACTGHHGVLTACVWLMVGGNVELRINAGEEAS
eukprot:gene6103-2701_t